MLNSRPARNEAVGWDKVESGEVQIKIVRQDTWKIRMMAKVFYIPKERKITLDEVGSEVWLMCNGKTSVEQMIESLSTKYQLNRKEAEVSLLSYLKTLGQKRFVGFMLETQKASQGNSNASGKKWE